MKRAPIERAAAIAGQNGSVLSVQQLRRAKTGLVITGKAAKPTYLYIKSEKRRGSDEVETSLELRDASHLWGTDHFECYDRLLEETDPKARAATIASLTGSAAPTLREERLSEKNCLRPLDIGFRSYNISLRYELRDTPKRRSGCPFQGAWTNTATDDR